MALACGTGSSFALQHRSKGAAFKRSAPRQTVARAATMQKGIEAEEYVQAAPDSLLRPGVDTSSSTKARFEKIIRAAQDSICKAISEIDGTPFHQDAWTRPGGGGGITRVLQDGSVWEKAGVNVSVVYGSMPPEAYRAAVGNNSAMRNVTDPAARVPFFAAGISSVMHPKNPFAPTKAVCLRVCAWRKGSTARSHLCWAPPPGWACATPSWAWLTS